MQRSLLVLSLFAIIGLTDAADSRVLYRYKDEHGVTVLNNVLPPEVVPRGYTVLSPQGQVLQEVPPARTKEQIEADKKAEEAAKLAAAQRAEQAKHDAMLLASFTNMEDITRARDNQLSAIDVTISVAEGNISRVKSQLESQQSRAADLERRGEKIPETLTKDISDSLRQIKESETFIADKRQEQDRLRKRFEKDIVRFQELHAERLLRAASNGSGNGSTQEHGVYQCSSRAQCDKAWALAQLYAREKASTRLEIITNTIILTAEPKSDQDLSLAFSRIPEKGEKEQIVVEVRCASTEGGKARCDGDDAKAVRNGFNDYVDNRLKQ